MSSEPYFPLPSEGVKSGNGRATATCYCGAVQLEFPTEQSGGLVDTFVCNCTDCRKITASTYASNFIVTDESVKHLRGADKLTAFKQSRTVATGNSMENHFCSVCGTLMYRVSSGFPGKKVMRIGTVDDFKLHDTALRPRVEQFVKDRAAWTSGGEKGNIEQMEGNYYDSRHPRFGGSGSAE